jgi:serine/threonine protein phosphatase PrpC
MAAERMAAADADAERQAAAAADAERLQAELAEAQRLADEQATPGAIVEALKTLELPITHLPEDWAGVISVTGHSAKSWNEDSAVAFFVDHWLLGACDVLMVFDGMGGLRDGKLASKLAALTMAIELNRTPDTVPSDLQSHLVAAFERVNRRFKKASETLYGKVDSDAMRSTAIVLLATQTHYVVGHQGDGHAHVRRADGTVQPLISAHKGGASNVITHSLGPQPDGQASVSKHLRQPGDLVYIASDGFDPLPADQAMAFLHDHSERHAMQVVAQGLTDAALGQRDEHGPIADDNMSLVALRTPARIDLAPPTAEATTDETPKEHTP